ncbi:MAG: carbonate dehydratase [Deltaproteobacteria bacterium]|nr:carbonate dehydratase [Deltaproteobacteria bacterium]
MAFRKQLFDNNRRWAARMKQADPEFFAKLVKQQAPDFLWIGCSDSRVPANEIVGLMPGELFVHRNVANVVIHTDLNCLSVLQYAVEVLGVEHIMVCGHYGCGGVATAMENKELGLIDNWLRTIKDVYHQNRAIIEEIDDKEQRLNLLCELNVAQQVANVTHTTIVQNAWKRGRALSVHGFIYDIHDGLLRDLGFSITGPDQIGEIYRIDA